MEERRMAVAEFLKTGQELSIDGFILERAVSP